VFIGVRVVKAGFAIVVDVGKTLSKVTLWSRNGQFLDRQVRANATPSEGGVRRLDVSGIATWLVEALSKYASHPVQYIVPVGHGAGVAAIVDGKLAFPPLDYEQALPGETLARYRQQRSPFAVTGSPALPDGLNFGAQLFWLEQLYPSEMQRATLLPWAQYWGWFLSGVATSEVTSLGCHSDLWMPAKAKFSPLADQMGWTDQFAELQNAGTPIGNLRNELVARTGLSNNVKILAGLHDSNAALLAVRGFSVLADREATILSTGTWFIGMRLPQGQNSAEAVAEERDCLVNVDVAGNAVPSARFMGGREIESVIELDSRRVDIIADQPALISAVQSVVDLGAMLLPTLAPGCGPFPNGKSRWISRPDEWQATRTAACLYAALVADAALDLIDSRERLVIEGRFAGAEVFIRALARLRPETVVYRANAQNDVSFGALRLVDPALLPQGSLDVIAPLDVDLTGYRASWYAAIAEAV
jgi:sugar (pentulose or hexulose) kinase